GQQGGGPGQQGVGMIEQGRLDGGSDLRCVLEQRGFTSVLHVAGTLDRSTSPFLRSAFLKCLADEPELIVLELAGMRLTDEVVLTVLPALARHAAIWPGSPVALAAVTPPVASALDRMAACRSIPRFASLSAAIAHTECGAASRRFRTRLEPTLAA